MLRLSIVTGALLATAAGLSTAPAQACVLDALGRVPCGPHLDPSQYRDPYDRGAVLPVGYCPSGTVAGINGVCIRWRLTRGAKCPPNMTVVDGECRPYSNPYPY